MASVIDTIRRRDSFEQILKSLSSKIDIEDLENELSGIQSLADKTIQGGWYKRHLTEWYQTEEISPIKVFILLVAFAWVYTFENTTAKPKENLQLLVVLAKYIWPLFELFILPDSGKTPGALSNEDVKNWLMDRRNYQSVIEELDVKIPPEVIGYATVEIRKDSATISRWLAIGTARLHQELCALLDIEPEIPGPIEQTPSVSGEKLPDQPPSADQETSRWNPPQEQMNEFLRIFNSPLRGYLVPDIWDTLNKLWQQQNSLPTLKQTAEFYIEQHLSSTNLDRDQRVLARELLSDIPSWCASKARLVQPISRGELENRWRGVYSENISPLLNGLLEQELLIQDGYGLRIKNQFVFDYLLARRRFEEELTFILPPMDDVVPSRWFYWMLQEFSDRNEPAEAGKALWEIQGSFPGYCSGSWEEIAAILDILPDALLSVPRIWILAKIAVKCQPFIHPDGARPFTPAYRLQARLPAQPTRIIKEAEDCVKEYMDGLNQLIAEFQFKDGVISKAISPIFWGTAKKWMLKKQALSAVRLLPQDTPVAAKGLSVKHGEKTLKNTLLAQLRAASSDEERLAIAEPLIAWGVKEAGNYIREYSASEKEYSCRSWILKQAIKGLPGYADWV